MFYFLSLSLSLSFIIYIYIYSGQNISIKFVFQQKEKILTIVNFPPLLYSIRSIKFSIHQDGNKPAIVNPVNPHLPYLFHHSHQQQQSQKISRRYTYKERVRTHSALCTNKQNSWNHHFSKTHVGRKRTAVFEFGGISLDKDAWESLPSLFLE